MLGQSVGTDVNYGRNIASGQMIDERPEDNYAPLIGMYGRTWVVCPVNLYVQEIR